MSEQNELKKEGKKCRERNALVLINGYANPRKMKGLTRQLITGLKLSGR